MPPDPKPSASREAMGRPEPIQRGPEGVARGATRITTGSIEGGGLMAQLWFKFWAKDYLADTKVRRLTYEQRGILQALWAFAWEEGSIPSDQEELGNMLGIPAKAMRTHSEWICRFFVPMEGSGSKLFSPRLEMDRAEADAKGAKARESALQMWSKRKANAYANASLDAERTDMQWVSEQVCVSHAGQSQSTEKETTTPLPPKGEIPPASPSGVGKKASWTKALPWDVVEATREIKHIWPSPTRGEYQPDGKTLVPGVSPSELARRLFDAKSQGAELDVCVQIAERAVKEWRDGKWIKAPQHFFGKSKDAPFRAYYQAHITNEAMKVAS
jgi:uncharacterized protein YdaU (DUF1376 family)